MAKPKRSLRQQDADALRRQLAETRQAVENLHLVWGVWADDVRQDAERRHGPDAAEETLWTDPDYSLALDGRQPITEAAEAIQRAGAWFAKAEPVQPETGPTAEPEAEL